MGEFVKKTAFGYKPTSGGRSDPECTHVILTEDEYNRLLQQISGAEQEARNAKYDADKEIHRVQIDAQRRIESTEYEAAKDIEHLEKALAAEQKESALQRGLNANLLRITRERANADRKLKPKKEHTGYVVVSSMEKEHRYKDGNRRWCTVMLWETVLETPYTVDFEVEEVRRLIQELFQGDEEGNWLIVKIGITGNYPKGYADMICDKDWREVYRNYNVMLERRLKANYRTGFWEIIFLHTKPLAAVPSDMRAGRN
ncbi:MAG TPA: hypothetical protein DCW53_00940 [Rikenellaceae bacterium]|nr:hypothetical protein [Rikenellaceae bacterium]